MNRLKYLIPLIIIIIIIFFLGTTVIYKGTYLAKDLIQKDLPNVQLYSTKEGNNIEINSIKDKLYIINIFATWCSYCQSEKPWLAEVNKKYSIPIYGVLHFDEIKNVNPEIKEKIYKDILIDKEGILLSLLGSEGIPETLIVKDGKIVYHLRGPIDNKVFEKDINKAIKSLLE